MNKQDISIDDYTILIGERIQEWIDESLTFENGCKRETEEGDFAWFFTQKGEILYRSYLRRAGKIIALKFPNQESYEELENHTGVIYN